MAYKLVMDGCAKSHFFNVCASSPVESERTPLLKHFHHFYSYLFVEFDKFWLSEKPKDVMEFNRIRDLFENNIRTLLEDRSAHFKINITVDTVWILMTNKPKCFSLSLHCGKILKIVSVKYLKIAKNVAFLLLSVFTDFDNLKEMRLFWAIFKQIHDMFVNSNCNEKWKWELSLKLHSSLKQSQLWGPGAFLLNRP